MGFSRKGLIMDGNGDWLSNRVRKHRSHSPFRDISPVPSHFSEPVSFLRHRDVTVNLPRLPGVRKPVRDEDDDVQSHKSLPAVMHPLTLQSKDKRIYRHSENLIASSLPALTITRCSLSVKGTGCKTFSKLPPITKPKNVRKWETDPPRPPYRSGCRMDGAEGNGLCLIPAKASGASPRSRLTFQSPVVQEVHPINPDTTRPIRQTDHACPPLRSVLKKAPNREVFHCPMTAHLLEPFSEFQEHLRHQILHSPLPYRPTLPQVHVPGHKNQVDLLPSYRGLYGSLMERTVELCNSQGNNHPKITMTCPTPSPKHLCHTETRQAA